MTEDASFGTDDFIGGGQAEIAVPIVHGRYQFKFPLAIQGDFLQLALRTRRRIDVRLARRKHDDLRLVVLQRQLHARAGYCLANYA